MNGSMEVTAMNYEGWLELALVVLLGTSGQIALKYALLESPPLRRSVSALVSLPIFIWLVCYGATTILWLLALRTIPLSQAFPMLGLQYALIPLASGRMLRERLQPMQWGGIGLIVVGVALVGRS
jgi:undecaprenyl phosphate-alpha-L-ara4N flippase subunit ArnE